MDIQLDIDLSQANRAFAQWQAQSTQALYAAVAEGFRRGGQEIAQAMQSHVERRLRVKRRSFARSFKHKVVFHDKTRPPVLWLGSRIPWIAMHEYGGTISQRMLIPLGLRVGRQRFKQIINTLMRAGNAFFQRSKEGRVFLFAENLAEHDRQLARFKRAYRHNHQIKSIKRGTEIPIAELVTRVQLRQRLGIRRLVTTQLPLLQAEILRATDRLL